MDNLVVLSSQLFPRFVFKIVLSRTSSLFPFMLHFVLLSDGAAVSYRNTFYLRFLPNPTKPDCGNEFLIPFFWLFNRMSNRPYNIFGIRRKRTLPFTLGARIGYSFGEVFV